MNRRFHSFLTATLIVVGCLFSAKSINAQELNCVVEINSDQITGQEHVFETLKEAVNDYMNTTKFTNAQFSPSEKIDCRLFLTVKEYSDDVIKGDLQVQSTRPVYNSSYTTTLLNYKDTRIEFTYRENEPLVFSETTMESNLTALLNYYAYLILALDFDSFSPQGGQPFFDRLQTIVQLAQSAGEVGWKQFEDNRNRSAVLSVFVDPQTSAIRDLLYKYHRQGLDQMSVSPDKGRANITESLKTLEKIQQVAPMSVGLNLWHDAKLDELINIYSKGSQSERDDVYNLLLELYPTEQLRLNDIKNPPPTR
ncbi:MAG: DUF4835 family protein [Bacteroides sp.]|nr:DUF4835 family protein [Bacteroides sp.]MCM1413355.1 DUF4835 family protein [Bacteroides sp.]MCM1471959.1 DUF4835 family protein [Bacteroides sp.]